MLEITVCLSQNSIRMSGHANYNEQGKDIVCSAASILFYTLADTLTKFKDGLKKEPRIHIRGENEKKIDCFISCRPKEEYMLNFQTVYFTIVNGFELLANGYPENISLKFIE